MINEKGNNLNIFSQEQGSNESEPLKEIFKNENCTIFSDSMEDNTMEIIDFNNDEIKIQGFLLKDNNQEKDIGYLTFFTQGKDDSTSLNVNYLHTRYISEIKEFFPESTQNSLNNESFKKELLAAIKIYPEFENKGLGKFLMEYGMKYLVKNGFKELRIYSDTTAMTESKKGSFYEKIGHGHFKRDGINIVIDLKGWYESFSKEESM
jgi:GNAT superfamily N-acetyltransferase